jgi:hypothetical protein
MVTDKILGGFWILIASTIIQFAVIVVLVKKFVNFMEPVRTLLVPCFRGKQGNEVVVFGSQFLDVVAHVVGGLR